MPFDTVALDLKLGIYNLCTLKNNVKIAYFLNTFPEYFNIHCVPKKFGEDYQEKITKQKIQTNFLYCPIK